MWDLDVIEKSTYISFEHQIKQIISQLCGRKVAVWGASIRGMIAGVVLEECGISTFEYIDSDIEKQGNLLSGHVIIPFNPNDRTVTILISMENQSSVKKVLEESGWEENEDFFCLVSSDVDELMVQIKTLKNYRHLLLGASCLHAVPLEERKENDLSEMIRDRSKESFKILGLSCMGMKVMYYLLILESMINHQIYSLGIIVSWETLTSFHHLLPRTQKPALVKRILEYAEECSFFSLYESLLEEYKIAKERVEDYILEKRYSINTMKENNKSTLKDYLDKGLMEPLDMNCEEIQYLIKILDFAIKKGIDTTIIVEPIDMKLCRSLYGKQFDERYMNKCRAVENLAKKYRAHFINASDILSGESIVSKHTANEAFYFEGRCKLAELIVDASTD